VSSAMWGRVLRIEVRVSKFGLVRRTSHEREGTGTPKLMEGRLLPRTVVALNDEGVS
jgi:hypothetical protein